MSSRPISEFEQCILQHRFPYNMLQRKQTTKQDSAASNDGISRDAIIAHKGIFHTPSIMLRRRGEMENTEFVSPSSRPIMKGNQRGPIIQEVWKTPVFDRGTPDQQDTESHEESSQCHQLQPIFSPISVHGEFATVWAMQNRPFAIAKKESPTKRVTFAKPLQRFLDAETRWHSNHPRDCNAPKNGKGNRGVLLDSSSSSRSPSSSPPTIPKRYAQEVGHVQTKKGYY